MGQMSESDEGGQHQKEDSQTETTKTKRKLTRAASPTPNPGIIRDLTPADVAGSDYIGPDVNIAFFGEEAMKSFFRGEEIMIVPIPGQKRNPEESERRARETYPELSNITKASMRRASREWGR